MDLQYATYVKEQADANTALLGLVRFLDENMDAEQKYPAGITCLDYRDNASQPPEFWRIDPQDGRLRRALNGKCEQSVSVTVPIPKPFGVSRETELEDITILPQDVQGRIVLVEDIDALTIACLGGKLNINPVFFATYIDSTFLEFEKHPPPPSISVLPSEALTQAGAHIHFQRVLDLGGITKEIGKTMRIESNIKRSVKATPRLTDKHLALARSCYSIVETKTTDDKWIYLILVDATRADIRASHTTRFSQNALHGQLVNYEEVSSYSEWASNCELAIIPKGSFSSNRRRYKTEESSYKALIRLFQNPSPYFNAADPDLLSIAYHPIKIALSEWRIYSLLLSRYVKHYEYSLISRKLRLQQSNLEELQPWRRRCTQSQLKLKHLRLFISRHSAKANEESAKDIWELILADVDHISSQIGQWAGFLESMVSMLDTHQCLIEAQDARRMTYVVLAFVPLNLVAGIFSMNEQSLAGNSNLRIYFAVAVPMTLVFVGFCSLARRGINAFQP